MDQHRITPLSQFTWLLFVLFAAAGVAVVAYLTRSGPGVSGDAVHYMDGATNLLQGHGYSRSVWDGSYTPITGFPPFFSIAIAGFSLFTGSALDGGRLLNMLLMGANLFLVGWLIYRLTRSLWAAAVASLFLVLARDLLLYHAWVMSEALYIFLTLLSLLFLSLYWERQKMWLLLVMGLATGLAVITRYVGAALVGALGLGVLLFGRPTWKRRFVDAAIFGITSVVPLAAWFLRNALLAGNLTARETAYHPISRTLLVAFFDEISSWFVPPELGFFWKLRLMTFVLFVLAGLALFSWSIFRRDWVRSAAASASIQFQGTLAGYILFYLIVLVLNSLALDASTSTFGMRRYLLPVFVAMVTWMVIVVHHALWKAPTVTNGRATEGSMLTTETQSTRSVLRISVVPRLPLIAKIIALVAAVLLLSIYIRQAVTFISEPGFVLGYTDYKNTSPELVAALQAIDPQRTIITNDYELTYFLAGRAPLALPQATENFTHQANPEFDAQLQRVEQLLSDGAVLVTINEEKDPNIAEFTAGLVHWQVHGRAIFYVDPTYLEGR